MPDPTSLRIPPSWLEPAALFALAVIVCSACTFPDADRRAIEASLDDDSEDPLEYYTTHSPTTDPGEYDGLLDGLPEDVSGIVESVQRVLVRYDAVEQAGFPNGKRRCDRESRIGTVRGMLERIAELDDRPLTEPRTEENRLVGICAHHAMLTTALLRHQGYPARARGGFETHFSETRHHDHWIAEYWDAEASRWVRVDAEIDGPDLPEGSFLTGAEAWRRCRTEGKPPEHFGIWGGEWIGGLEFVLNELVLDFNALNKVESLPWDATVFAEKGYENLTAGELQLLDRVAEAVVEGNAGFAKVRDLFKANPRLRKS